MEVATSIATAAALDEVDARRHRVVAADCYIGRWMRIAALLLLTSAFSMQELATHLTRSMHQLTAGLSATASTKENKIMRVVV